MSCNVSVRIVVEGYEFEAEQEIVAAVRAVLEREQLTAYFTAVKAQLASNETRQVTTRTLSPIVVSGVSDWETTLQQTMMKRVIGANMKPCLVQLDVTDGDVEAER